VVLCAIAVPIRSHAQQTDDFTQRTRIKFRTCDREEVLSDFPTLVEISTNTPLFDYADMASPGGADLRFFDETLTQMLDFELEEWHTSGTSYAWVKVPALTNHAVIWMAWGNTNVLELPPSATNSSAWDADFKIVHHFPATLEDATTNDYDGVASNAAVVSGLVSDSAQYTNGEVKLAAYTMTAQMTFSTWFRIPTNGGGQWLFMDWAAGNSMDYRVYPGQIRSWEGWTSLETLEAAVTTDERHHLAVTRQHGNNYVLYYLDGVYVGSLSAYGAIIQQDFYAGHDFTGSLDEWRVSNVIRSPEWIRAVWSNSGCGPMISALTCRRLWAAQCSASGRTYPFIPASLECADDPDGLAAVQPGRGLSRPLEHQVQINRRKLRKLKVFARSRAELSGMGITHARYVLSHD
jgi:hypothetical protein